MNTVALGNEEDHAQQYHSTSTTEVSKEYFMRKIKKTQPKPVDYVLQENNK